MSKAVLVVSYDQPEEFDAAYNRVTDIANAIREHFVDQKDVRIHIGIKETAESVLNVFKENE